MWRVISLLLLLAGSVFAYDKIVNYYTRNYDYVGVVSSTNAANILISTPTAVGQQWYCTDCVADTICVSTGLAVGSQVRSSSRTFKCQ